MFHWELEEKREREKKKSKLKWNNPIIMSTDSVENLERSLERTPTWAVAVVVFVIIVISIFIEHIIHLIGHVSPILYITSLVFLYVINILAQNLIFFFLFLSSSLLWSFQWLQHKHKAALYEALEKVKAGTYICNLVSLYVDINLFSYCCNLKLFCVICLKDLTGFGSFFFFFFFLCV